jgi:hypothetical protein
MLILKEVGGNIVAGKTEGGWRGGRETCGENEKDIRKAQCRCVGTKKMGGIV